MMWKLSKTKRWDIRSRDFVSTISPTNETIVLETGLDISWVGTKWMVVTMSRIRAKCLHCLRNVVTPSCQLMIHFSTAVGFALTTPGAVVVYLVNSRRTKKTCLWSLIARRDTTLPMCCFACTIYTPLTVLQLSFFALADSPYIRRWLFCNYPSLHWRIPLIYAADCSAAILLCTGGFPFDDDDLSRNLRATLVRR